MEHESFENEQIAAVLNEHFVSVKVDREERPDVDEIYMHVTMQMTGHGGWPMSVMLTPDRVPFWAGTYVPPQNFHQLLQRIAEMWQDERELILEGRVSLVESLQSWAKGPEPAPNLIGPDAVSRAADTLVRYFDRQYGGLPGGGSNKFPPSMTMELMLREYHRSGDKNLLATVELTLDHMARGGIYDHLGGGICRYSTDVRWLVPHFEKMLYDQALVSSIYLDARQVTGKKGYGRVAADIFDYVLADLQSPEGGLYSTRDADSEGLEGAYYIWTVGQVTEVLGEKDAGLFCDFYDVSEGGNWFESRGHAPTGPKNILNVPVPLEKYASKHDLDPADLEKRLASMRARLLEVRGKRVPPGLDDKILAGWNGLMIASLAKGARVLDEPKYAQAAARAADFVLTRLRRDGRLLRSYRAGKSHLTGYLSDYAFMIEGLLNLYEATFDTRWLTEAAALNETLIEHYYDEEGGAFFFTADDAEELLARTKNPRDGAIPSGNSVQAMNLLRLAIVLDRKDYRAKAESIFRAFKPMAERSAASFERLLCAADFLHGSPKEIALVGNPAEPGTEAMIRAVYDRFLPNKVVALGAGDGASSGGDTGGEALIPLLAGKKRIEGGATAYVCEGYRCKAPVTSADDLARQLDAK